MRKREKNKKATNILKIHLTIFLSLIVLFIGLGSLIKAIDAISIEKRIFEIIGFYISVFAFHLSNSILKDYIKEYKH